MSSKSKRKHAQKGYNRANTGMSVEAIKERQAAENEPAGTALVNGVPTAEPTFQATILTPKELRKMESEKRKQLKSEAKSVKQQSKQSPKGKDKKDKKEKKEKRNIFAEMGSELKKVHWPTWNEAWKATGIVLGVTVVFGLVLLGLDRFLGWLYEMLIGGNK